MLHNYYSTQLEFISSEATSQCQHVGTTIWNGWIIASQLLHWENTTVADPLVNGANVANGAREVCELHMHRNVLPCIVSATSGSTRIGANTVA